MHTLAQLVGPVFYPTLVIAMVGLAIQFFAAHILFSTDQARHRDPEIRQTRDLIRLADWFPGAAASFGLIGTLLGFASALTHLASAQAELAVEPLTQAVVSTIFGQVVALVLSLVSAVVAHICDHREVNAVAPQRVRLQPLARLCRGSEPSVAMNPSFNELDVDIITSGGELES